MQRIHIALCVLALLALVSSAFFSEKIHQHGPAFYTVGERRSLFVWPHSSSSPSPAAAASTAVGTSLVFPAVGDMRAANDTGDADTGFSLLLRFDPSTGAASAEEEEEGEGEATKKKKPQCSGPRCHRWVPSRAAAAAANAQTVVLVAPTLTAVTREGRRRIGGGGGGGGDALVRLDVRLTAYEAHNGTSAFGSVGTVLHFAGVRPESGGDGEWLVLGRLQYASGAARRILSSRGRGEKGDGGAELSRTEEELLGNFSEGSLTEARALQLFARVDAAAARNATSNVTDVLDEECVWLLRARWEGEVMRGALYSSCGARAALLATVPRYHRLAARLNTAFAVLAAAAVAPLLGGCVHLYRWLLHSRTRCLRVSVLQLLLVLLLTTCLRHLTGFAAASVRAPLRSVAVARLGCVVSEWVLLLLVLYASAEAGALRATGNDAADDANNRHNRHTQMYLYLYIFLQVSSGAVSYAGGVALLPYVLVPLSLLYWAPQLVLVVTGDGATGLTVPFIAGAAALPCVPLLLLLALPLEPWALPAGARGAVAAGLCALLAGAALLAALRLLGNRRVLPAWLAPWRHVYHTTAAAEEAALADGAICPVCRESLAEGWGDDDELWRTPCRHLFHRSCLERCMEERAVCPVCRALLPDP